MSTGKVIDCILFNNEIDLLRLRIQYLSDVVDEFVIFESSRTFSGRAKPLYAYNSRAELETLTSKKISFWVANLQKMSGQQFSERWPIEHETRKQFLKRITSEHSKDRIIFGDLDEIPSVSQVESIRELLIENDVSIYGINTPTFYRYVNWFVQGVGEKMNAPKTFVGAHPPSLDLIRALDHFIDIEGVGAHLSYLGMSADKIGQKFQDFSHSEFAGQESIEGFIHRAQDRFAIDHIGRYFFEGNGLIKVIPLADLPDPCTFLANSYPLYFKDFTVPGKFRRLVASAAVTFLRQYMMKEKRPTFSKCLTSIGLFRFSRPIFLLFFKIKGFYWVLTHYGR
jgi:beta-1,4-mannosyl-glycoprotein beta-1,4-N-acetylglucosaminyltransferase